MSLPRNLPAIRPESIVPPSEYSPEERRLLFQLAHEAITARLQGREQDTTPPTERLAQYRGAFTTLHLNGDLRGCVGYVYPLFSLYRTIAETAVAAAFQDPRFPPVTPEEAPDLKIEISVLSPLRAIEPEQIELGRHGLVVSLGSNRGLLLPQVPAEHGWDCETFLCQTCVKAGLPHDAWRRGARVEAFTAEIFQE